MIKPTLEQLVRMIGNPNTYAVQQDDGSWYPVRDLLSREVLEDHLAGTKTVGTYIGHRQEDEETGADGQWTGARTLCFDIDDGDMESAAKIAAALGELGFPPGAEGIEFSGKKGYHVWVVLQDYRPNRELRRVGRAALALAGVQCEVYPKQDEVRDLGNLVKMPGGVHRVTGKHNDFVDQPPRPLPLVAWDRVLSGLPEEVHAKRASADSRFPCMEAIQDEGVGEGSRNIQLFHLAAMLRRAGVTAENVELLVRQTNDRSDPPLDEVELNTLLDSAGNSGPICSQLPEERQCGELCIMTRTSGLYTRPNQLRYAGVGENVVVTVSGRTGKVVEFEHDDVGRMKAVLRGD